MDVCYLYCTPVQESKSEFYALPVVRVAKMFENDDRVQVHAHAIGDLDTASLEKHNVCCHTTERLFPRLGLFSLYIQLFIEVVKLQRREDIDVFSNIWAHYHLMPVILAAKIFGASVLARVYGMGNTWTRSESEGSLLPGGDLSVRRIVIVRLLNRVELILLRLADQVYTDARAVVDVLVSNGVPRDQMAVISQGVDTEYFIPLADKPSRNLEINEPVVLFVGRLDSESKRLGDAYAVFNTVQSDIPDAKFVIAGSGTPPSPVCSVIESDDSVEMLGYLDRPSLRATYQEADTLLVTSEVEGVPNVVLESMACGLPVVATPAGDIPRLLESGGGIAIHSGDIDELAAAVVTILSDKEQRIACRERAREYIVSNHSIMSLSGQYFDLFDQ